MDPVNGNPFKLVITATYGLCEAVVAGSHAVDTIDFVREPFGKSDGDTKMSLRLREVVTSQKDRLIRVKHDGKWNRGCRDR